MLLSNQRIQRIAARAILLFMAVTIGSVVYEGVSSKVKTEETSEEDNESDIVATKEVSEKAIPISTVILIRNNVYDIEPIRLPLTISTKATNSSDNKLQLQQKAATAKEPVIQETQEELEEKMIKSFNVPEKDVQLETNYKYYEVFDPTDGNWYHMDQKLQEYTYDLCVEYNIEKYFTLILSQFYAESRYNPKAISKTKDYGISQINKSNHNRLKKALGITDFLDAEQSILAGIYMMSDHLERFDYNISKALVYYNTGKKYSSNPYSKRVLNFYDTIREIDNNDNN